MRLVLFLNNWGGWQIAKSLKEAGEAIVALVIQPETDQRFAAQILSALNMPAERIWRAPELRTPEAVAQLRALKPDIGVSGWFGYILKPDLLSVFGTGCINLHAAYLPWNRGWRTNVWPILDGSPAGVTIHFIDEGVDTGDIISQRIIPVAPNDTGGSLHQKLTLAMVDIFKVTWPLVKSGRYTRTPQDHTKATKHRRDDLEPLDLIDLDREYSGGELLNLLRARTCPPYPAAYVVKNSQRVYVRAQFPEEDAVRKESASRGSEVVDLEALYQARAFLDLLSWGYESGRPAAYFVHDGQRFYVTSQLVKEEEIDRGGLPAWVTAAS